MLYRIFQHESWQYGSVNTCTTKSGRVQWSLGGSISWSVESAGVERADKGASSMYGLAHQLLSPSQSQWFSVCWRGCQGLDKTGSIAGSLAWQFHKVTQGRALLLSAVGGIMIHYRAHPAQFWGLDSAITTPLFTTFFSLCKNLEFILGTIRQEILLILMTPMVLHLFSYLLWGTRNRSCQFLMLFLGIPWTYTDVWYVVGKVF